MRGYHVKVEVIVSQVSVTHRERSLRQSDLVSYLANIMGVGQVLSEFA